MASERPIGRARGGCLLRSFAFIAARLARRPGGPRQIRPGRPATSRGWRAQAVTSPFEYSLSGKWLELFKEIAPNLTRIAILRNPALAAGIGQLPRGNRLPLASPAGRWGRRVHTGPSPGRLPPVGGRGSFTSPRSSTNSTAIYGWTSPIIASFTTITILRTNR